MGADLISETLGRLDALVPQPQADAQATLAPMLKREDGLIDWSLDSYALNRRVRGLQPWPNAFTSFKSHRLIIWKAAPEWIEQLKFPPGQIIEARGDRLLVACGEGTALRIAELQIEGGRRLSVRDFLNGTHLAVGQPLGLD
jgi:methionyl-tRNA formyltransferase